MALSNQTIPSQITLIKGGGPGPTVVILGGTHGDELVGIRVVKMLLKNFGITNENGGDIVENMTVFGEIFIGLGNIAAIAINKRAASTGRDLNRSFIQKELDNPPLPDDRPDLTRARELSPILAKADYLFDIHSTSSESQPFVCFGHLVAGHKPLYSALPVKIVLTDPDKILGADDGLDEPGTTDGYVLAHGGIPIVYETGLDTDVAKSATVFNEILGLLRIVGSIPANGELLATKNDGPTVFKITHNIAAKGNHFTFEPTLKTGWLPIAAGQLVGRYENGLEEHSPADGMLIFPRAEHKITAGKNLYFIAVRVDDN